MANREIKFRGLRTDGNGWVYGYYYKLTESQNYIKKDLHQWKVMPESVGQFTGLKDKNGVDIYDGDIDDNGDVVSWCNNRQGWSMCVFEDSTFKNKAICHCYNCDGNFDIYEVSINIVSNIYES